jgi:iron complex outermembrane receptor protein
VVSETVDAFELGYRIEPARNFSVDIAAFYNVYEDLIESNQVRAVELASRPRPHLLVPIDFANSGSGETYGVEVSLQWKPIERWRLVANYSWLHMDLNPAGSTVKGSPQQQVSLRSYLELPWNLEFNSFASFVDGIQSVDTAGAARVIPSYLRVDGGVVWHPTNSVEFGIWGQNLLDNQHPESGSQSTVGITEIPRSVVGKFTWRF